MFLLILCHVFFLPTPPSPPVRLLISTPRHTNRLFRLYFYIYSHIEKRDRELRTVWKEYKEQGSVFMELNSSIDFYIPCTLLILTYVKTTQLPYIPRAVNHVWHTCNRHRSPPIGCNPLGSFICSTDVHCQHHEFSLFPLIRSWET
jgi:hypothetical protein